MKIGYARVSKHEQSHNLQQDALTAALCEQIYLDTCSGSIPAAERSQLQEALRSLRAGDTLVVWQLDRLGCSLPDLVKQINALAEKEIRFQSLREAIYTATPSGQVTLHLFAALAEFEQDRIRERVTVGLKAARARGRKGGRKPKLTGQKLRQASELMAEGKLQVGEIAKMVGVSRPTLYRHITPDGQLRRQPQNGLKA